jgi:phosphatidate phosphatase APP1
MYQGSMDLQTVIVGGIKASINDHPDRIRIDPTIYASMAKRIAGQLQSEYTRDIILSIRKKATEIEKNEKLEMLEKIKKLQQMNEHFRLKLEKHGIPLGHELT